MKCKNCGAELSNGKCEYCGSVFLEDVRYIELNIPSEKVAELVIACKKDAFRYRKRQSVNVCTVIYPQ